MRFGLREKTLVIPTLVLVVVVAVAAALVIPHLRRTYSAALDSRVEVICQNLKLQIERLLEQGLAFDDIEGHDEQCREVLEQHPDMSYAAVVDLDHRALSHSNPAMVGQILAGAARGQMSWESEDDGEELRHICTSIRSLGDDQRGYAVVGFPTALVAQHVSDLVVWISSVTIISGAVALVAAWAMMSLFVVRPLSWLKSAIRDIDDRDTPDQEVPVGSADEIGQLGVAINALLQGISSRDRRIDQHVDEWKEARDQLENRGAGWTAELPRTNESLREEMERRREAERQRESMHKELLEVSRRAGMADMATSVLHNVGNVLNSVNVTVTLLQERLTRSKVGSLIKAVDLLKAHQADLQQYLNEDSQGSQLLPFLEELGRVMTANQDELIRDTEDLIGHINHIKEIVNVQQSLARVSGTIEKFDLADAIEDSLKINLAGLERHGVDVERQYETGLTVEADRHKVIQILVNLISNAKYAIHETGRPGVLTVKVDRPHEDAICVSVVDTGIGLAPEVREQLFRHGFTTRKNGHGFGLHASAVAAQQLQGNITVHSDGPNRGATFTLHLPTTPSREEACATPAASVEQDY